MVIQQEKRVLAEAVRASKQAVAVLEKPVKTVREDVEVYIPKDLRRHVMRDYSVAHLHPYVNMRTLIGHHLGLRGYSDKLIEKEMSVQLGSMNSSLGSYVRIY